MINMSAWKLWVRDIVEALKYNNDDDEIVQVICDVVQHIVNEELAEAKQYAQEEKGGDVEPVVRCENCQFFENVEYWPDGTKKVCQLLKRQVLENSFCCWGMKKEVEDG